MLSLIKKNIKNLEAVIAADDLGETIFFCVGLKCILSGKRICQFPQLLSEFQMDILRPSIVFITLWALKFPDMFLPFTDFRFWRGEPFKCFPSELKCVYT